MESVETTYRIVYIIIMIFIINDIYNNHNCSAKLIYSMASNWEMGEKPEQTTL